MKYRPKPANNTLETYAERLTQLALIAQIVLTALYFNGFFTNPKVHKLLVGEYLALSAWCFFALQCVFSGRVRIAWSPLYLPAAILVLWAGVRAWTAPIPHSAAYFYPFFWIASALPLWITSFHDRRFRNLFAWTVFIVGALISLGCLRMIFSDNPSFRIFGFQAITLSPGSYERQRLGSFLGHNKPAAAYIWISAIYAGYLWYRYRLKTISVLFAGYIVLAVVLIYLSGSRGEALMLPVGLGMAGAAYYLSRHRAAQTNSAMPPTTPIQTRWALYAAGVGAALLIASVVFVQALSTEKGQGVIGRFTSASYQDLLSGTYPRVWWMSLLMARDNPLLGVGFESWSYKYPEYQGLWFNKQPRTSIGLPNVGFYTERAHNDFLHTWAELGVLGLFCQIWLFFIYLKLVFCLFRQHPMSPLGVAAAAATAGTLVRATVGFPFHEAAAACLFVANLGLLSQRNFSLLYTFKLPYFSRPGNQNQLRGLVLVPLFILLGLPAGNHAIGSYAERLYHRWLIKAQQDRQAGDWQAYQRSMEEAQSSLFTALHYGLPTSEKHVKYGNELIKQGMAEQKPETILQGVEHIERSLEGYQFYKSYYDLAVAYHSLLHLTGKERYAQSAEENYRQAVYILPTFYQGWMDLILLLGETGQIQESLDELRYVTLKYPKFIEESLIPSAKKAIRNNDYKLASLHYNLGISVTASNPNLFEASLAFYRQLNRVDMLKSQFIAMAPYQPLEKVEQELPKTLLVMLEQNQPVEAFELLVELSKMERFQNNDPVLYYLGVTAWLSGQPGSALASWQRLIDKGLNRQTVEPALTQLIIFWTPFVWG